MKSLKYILLISLFYLLLSAIGYKLFGMTPNEVDYFNRYFVMEAYDAFEYSPSIEIQLTSTAYDRNTLSALHYLESADYDFGWATKHILNVSDYHPNLNKPEILHALIFIKRQIGEKSYIVGYLIYYVKWLLIISIFEFARQLIIKMTKKKLKVEAL